MVRLTDGDVQAFGLIRLDGHQIILHHSHGVAINGEHISSSRRPIDEPQHVLLSLGERRVKVSAFSSQGVMAHPVHDEAVCPGTATRDLDIVSNKGRVVHVVLDEDRTKVNVPVTARGPVDHKWTGQAVRVL